MDGTICHACMLGHIGAAMRMPVKKFKGNLRERARHNIAQVDYGSDTSSMIICGSTNWGLKWRLLF